MTQAEVHHGKRAPVNVLRRCTVAKPIRIFNLFGRTIARG